MSLHNEITRHSSRKIEFPWWARLTSPRTASLALALITVILIGQIVIPSYAQQVPAFSSQRPPGGSPFEHDFTDVKLLNEYFGYPNQKIEVQLGDQNVPLTILFSNVGTEDLSGIRGFLSLPLGFSVATPLVDGGLVSR